jgi:putative ATP-dependent endonuclease of OLD family
LFAAGAHEEIAETLSELAPSGAAKTRAEGWQADPATFDAVQFLKDVNAISKGRFAQRLATRVAAGHLPGYIENAIDYARTRCR